MTTQSANNGRFQKGKKGGPGRPKGAPNKATAELKEAILEAFRLAGGEEYLKRQAEANPTAFMTLLGKVLPMTVQGDANKPLVFEVTGLGWLTETIRQRNG